MIPSLRAGHGVRTGHRGRAVRALRDAGYLLAAFLLALVGGVLTLAVVLVGAALLVTPVGAWVLAACTRGALGVTSVHRRLAEGVGAVVPGPPPEHAPPPDGGLAALRWRRRVLADRAGRQAVRFLLVKPLVTVPLAFGTLLWLAYAALLAGYPAVRLGDGDLVLGDRPLTSWPEQAFVSGCGLAALAAFPWLARAAVRADTAVLRSLLAPGRLRRRVQDLERTRAHAVTDADARLGQIERDLHDGAQARLVALGMKLAMIEGAADLDRARDLARAARGDTASTLAELRELVRGFRPPALADGLATALQSLVSEHPVEVRLTVDLPRRPAPEIEAIAYFCVAELLTNAARHSGCTRAQVDVAVPADRLVVRVGDDGGGGARPGGAGSGGPGPGAGGTGLAGLAVRVGTVDGTMHVDSPPGAGTTVTVELPLSAS